MRKLLLVLGVIGSSFAGNKIVYLVTTPRSLSTAAFRCFENRKDFVGFHESTRAVWDNHVWREKLEGGFVEDCYRTYDELETDILEKRKSSHVVVKDVIFMVEDFLLRNDTFTKNPDVHFVFLIRDPYWITQSYYIGSGAVCPIFYQLIGTKQLFSLYKRIQEVNPNRTHLLLANEFSCNPKKALEKIFKSLDLNLTNESLVWESLDESFTGSKWREQKTKEIFWYWHGAALKSSEIKPLKRLNTPEKEKMFEDATEKDREELMKMYEYHLPYYKKFLEEKRR